MTSPAEAADCSLMVGEGGAPPLPPVDPLIDRAHLARMTLGDRALENEVLALFDLQASLLLARMQAAGPAAIGALAHTLKGSARGIGAWKVAEAAEHVERCASECSATVLPIAIKALTGAVAEARMAISQLLRSH